MILRKSINTFILFVFCIGLLGSLALWVGAAPSSSHNVGLSLPGTNYPSGRDVQPCVGWNSFSWVLPPIEWDGVQPECGMEFFQLGLSSRRRAPGGMEFFQLGLSSRRRAPSGMEFLSLGFSTRKRAYFPNICGLEYIKAAYQR